MPKKTLFGVSLLMVVLAGLVAREVEKYEAGDCHENVEKTRKGDLW